MDLYRSMGGPNVRSTIYLVWHGMELGTRTSGPPKDRYRFIFFFQIILAQKPNYILFWSLTRHYYLNASGALIASSAPTSPGLSLHWTQTSFQDFGNFGVLKKIWQSHKAPKMKPTQKIFVRRRLRWGFIFGTSWVYQFFHRNSETSNNPGIKSEFRHWEGVTDIRDPGTRLRDQGP